MLRASKITVCFCEEDQEIIYSEVPPLFFIIHFHSLATVIAAQNQEVHLKLQLFFRLRQMHLNFFFFNIACPSLRGQGPQVQSQWQRMVVKFRYCEKARIFTKVNYFLLFQKHVFIFKMCFFRNELSFSKYVSFRNVLSFSKCERF